MKITEENNPNTLDIDELSTFEIISKINKEDKLVAKAVEKSLESINTFIIDTINVLNNGGKLFYIGAGTSGRLGVLDASECPPTFGVSSDLVQAIIAGGQPALTHSVEGAEDNEEFAVKAIDSVVSKDDIILGISASSTTPFVISALKRASSIGAYTGLLICNKIDKQSFINTLIEIVVGPEILSGSTRMKAGTATKMVLNMISTATMIKLNYTFGNLLVGIQPVNTKLIDRSVRIIGEITGANYSKSKKILEESNYCIKEAILMISLDITSIKAKKLLRKNDGRLKSIIK